MLIIICGLPGTGKTTAARHAAGLLGAAHLRTDEIRKELFTKPTYSEEEKRAVYEEMFWQAKEILKNQRLILDATFLRAAGRQRALALAEAVGKPWLILETVCPEEIARQRLAARKNDASDAGYAQYLELKKFWEPIAEPHFQIDTAGDYQKQIEDIINKKAAQG